MANKLTERLEEIHNSNLDATEKFAERMEVIAEDYLDKKKGEMKKELIPKDKYRVGLYARVSTKDKGQDTENQLILLREYCERRNWPIVMEYVDHVSGKKGVDREQFLRLFEDARLRKFDLVMFWSLDRFSREGVLETLQYLQKLTASGVEWKSYTEQYLDSLGVFRDAVLAILATIAKQERIRLSERSIAGIARAREKGTKSGNTIGRQRTICDREGIYRMNKEGLSFGEIAKKVGLPRSTVHKIVKDWKDKDEGGK